MYDETFYDSRKRWGHLNLASRLIHNPNFTFTSQNAWNAEAPYIEPEQIRTPWAWGNVYRAPEAMSLAPSQTRIFILSLTLDKSNEGIRDALRE